MANGGGASRVLMDWRCIIGASSGGNDDGYIVETHFLKVRDEIRSP